MDEVTIEENKNVPYCLGRLFAVLEKVRGEDFPAILHHNVIHTGICICSLAESTEIKNQ